jgi:hypothetical protein
MQRRKAPPRREGTAPDTSPTARILTRARAIVVSIAAAAAGAGAILDVPEKVDRLLRGDDTGAQVPTRRLTVAELLVENPPHRIPALELVLHNEGAKRVVLNRAVFRIRRFTRLSTCFFQGDLDVAKTFAVTLPARPTPDQSVEVSRLARQLAPDEVERLRFRFSLPVRSLRVGRRRIAISAAQNDDRYLYAIDMSVYHDRRRVPLNAGSFLVSLPFVPGTQLWTKGAEVSGFLGPDPDSVVSCEKANSKALRAFIETPGERAPALSRVAARLEPGVDVSHDKMIREATRACAHVSEREVPIHASSRELRADGRRWDSAVVRLERLNPPVADARSYYTWVQAMRDYAGSLEWMADTLRTANHRYARRSAQHTLSVVHRSARSLGIC